MGCLISSCCRTAVECACTLKSEQPPWVMGDVGKLREFLRVFGIAAGLSFSLLTVAYASNPADEITVSAACEGVDFGGAKATMARRKGPDTVIASGGALVGAVARIAATFYPGKQVHQSIAYDRLLLRVCPGCDAPARLGSLQRYGKGGGLLDGLPVLLEGISHGCHKVGAICGDVDSPRRAQ